VLRLAGLGQWHLLERVPVVNGNQSNLNAAEQRLWEAEQLKPAQECLNVAYVHFYSLSLLLTFVSLLLTFVYVGVSLESRSTHNRWRVVVQVGGVVHTKRGAAQRKQCALEVQLATEVRLLLCDRVHGFRCLRFDSSV
jgi:hypothetical protein